MEVSLPTEREVQRIKTLVYAPRRNVINKKAYVRKRAAGLCGQCFHAPSREGSSVCAQCAERALAVAHTPEYRAKRNAAKRKRNIEKFARGECKHCSSPALPGRKACQRHRDSTLARYKKLRAKYASQGLCLDCGRPVVDKLWCPKHKALRAGRARVMNAKRVAKRRQQKGLNHGRHQELTISVGAE